MAKGYPYAHINNPHPGRAIFVLLEVLGPNISLIFHIDMVLVLIY